MTTILIILAVAAGIGGLIALFSGGKKEDVAAGAAAGAMLTGSCLFQLLIAGAMALAGIWLLSKIFR